MICIPIVANNLDDAVKDMAEASRFADIVELRIDYMKRPDLKSLLERRTKPVIVTNRPVREGGKFEGNEEDRLSLLKLAIQLQADYVDIEHDSIQRLRDDAALNALTGKTKLIVSYHHFQETPGNVSEMYQKLSKSGADIIKIVTFATTIVDNITIYRLLQQAKTPLISFCMGEYGTISRILYKKFGSYLTFASLQKGKESAPGQVSIHELLNVYRVNSQDKQTAIYGLIGNPVSHSIGPYIHNALFKELGLNAVYVPFKVDRVAEFIKEFKALDSRGYSVTIPHKESVIGCLDAIDPMAKKIGAANTVVCKDGRLVGYNTDCEAAMKTLECAIEGASHGSSQTKPATTNNALLKGKTAAILGAGGAARAVAFGLKHRGAMVTILNRNYERAQLLADDVRCLTGKHADFQVDQTDIIINATPVGMFPAVDDTPIDRNKLKPGMVIFDTIYNPLETRLLREARKQGCTVVGGLPMFARQAAEQFQLWTGRTPSLESIEKIACERLANTQSRNDKHLPIKKS
ncbi:MAG: shikimate dehydrogenase [Planctomycetes bacterium]|nr:shikimate dehydrogenase [Planctomycetota bacterium]